MKKIILLLFLATCNLHSQNFIADDKAAHFLGGALVSQTTYHLVLNKTKDKKKAVIWAIATPIIVGTLKECVDYANPKKRNFDVKDIMYTSGGATILFTVNFKL